MGFFWSLLKLMNPQLSDLPNIDFKPKPRLNEVPRFCTRNGRVIPIVKRGTRELWAEKGWTLRNGILVGYYRGKRKMFKGKVENPFSCPHFYIFDPSIEVLTGRHGNCFFEREKNIYSVHFSPTPKDVSAGILRIEHCLIDKGI